MLTVTDTTCARHDTIGGACSRESNTLRYGHHTFHQHACVDNFLDEAGPARPGQARPGVQHQLVHERARRRGRHARDRRRHLGPRAVRRGARRDGRAGADLELPADQQPVQRVRPHPGPTGDHRTGTRREGRGARRRAPHHGPGPAGSGRLLAHRRATERPDGRPLPCAGEPDRRQPRRRRDARADGPGADAAVHRRHASSPGAARRSRPPWTGSRCPRGGPWPSPPGRRWRSARCTARASVPTWPCAAASTCRPTWAAARPSPWAASAGSTAGRSPPATCCRSATRWPASRRTAAPGAWHRSMRHEWRIGVLVGPHTAPEFLTERGAGRAGRRRLGGAPQLGAHRGAPGRPPARLGPGRRRRGRPAPLQHPRHRLRDRCGRPDRRHAGDPRTRRAQPGRVRLPGGGGRRRAMEARPALPRRPGAAGAVEPGAPPTRRGSGGSASSSVR